MVLHNNCQVLETSMNMNFKVVKNPSISISKHLYVNERIKQLKQKEGGGGRERRRK